MNAAQIESAILLVVGERWMKVARVIAKVVDAMGANLPTGDEGCELVSEHIEALVCGGRLEAWGDTRNWRFSEVRLNDAPNDKEAMSDKAILRQLIKPLERIPEGGGEDSCCILTPNRILVWLTRILSNKPVLPGETSGTPSSFRPTLSPVGSLTSFCSY